MIPVFFAQSVDLVQPLLNSGILGVILLWFMLRLETRLKATESASNRMTRMLLLLVVSLKSANEAAKAEAHEIGREIENAEGKNRSNE